MIGADIRWDRRRRGSARSDRGDILWNDEGAGRRHDDDDLGPGRCDRREWRSRAHCTGTGGTTRDDIRSQRCLRRGFVVDDPPHGRHRGGGRHGRTGRGRPSQHPGCHRCRRDRIGGTKKDARCRSISKVVIVHGAAAPACGDCGSRSVDRRRGQQRQFGHERKRRHVSNCPTDS